MYYVAETDQLIADGVIDHAQGEEIKARARAAMVALCVNTLLIGGIVAATFGLVFYLADALSVAICGGLFLGGGLLILRYGAVLYRMFGNASAVIGAGMLIAGSGIEIADNLPDTSGPWLWLIGAGIGGLFLWRFRLGLPQLRFAYGAALLMAVMLHLTGLYLTTEQWDLQGWSMPLAHFYAFAVIVALGRVTDIRLITALAIVPFAQMLDTSTAYRSGIYIFYSHESTLSILQMGLLIAVCLWIGSKGGRKTQRQAGVLAILAFVVANLCALVGSLSGDVVGQYLWGPGHWWTFDGSWEEQRAAINAFRETTLVISEGVYSILWAAALAALVIWAALKNQRGLFNTGVTFAGIHAYTQMFESFYDEPLAYVIGGLVAIPLAFGLWRLNNAWFKPVKVGAAT